MPLHMRLPKLKGFRNRFRTEYQVVNVGDLARLFPDGGEIGPRELVEAGAVRRNQLVKVLGEGELGGRGADRHRAQVLRQRPGEDHRPPAGTAEPALTPQSRDERRPGPATTAGPAAVPGTTTRHYQEGISECSARSGRPWPRRISGRRSSSRSMIVAVYRLGATIPSPGVSYPNVQECIRQVEGGENSSVYSLLNLFTGGALLQLSIFALGIMPYITSSIIVQLLTVVIPRFEQLKKEGQSGQSKLTQYTRYLTIALAILQATGIVALADRGQLFGDCSLPVIPDSSIFNLTIIVITMTAGTAVIMWLGELITERGIGNGMSLLIFASIAARIPAEGANILRNGGAGLRRRLLLRAGHHRQRGLRRAGPAPDPGAVRQAHGRPPDVRRHLDLPAAEGEPGRRHPGHLRLVAALPAGPDRPAGRHHRRRRSSSSCRPTWSTSRAGCTSRCTSR